MFQTELNNQLGLGLLYSSTNTNTKWFNIKSGFICMGEDKQCSMVTYIDVNLHRFLKLKINYIMYENSW